MLNNGRKKKGSSFPWISLPGCEIFYQGSFEEKIKGRFSLRSIFFMKTGARL